MVSIVKAALLQRTEENWDEDAAAIRVENFLWINRGQGTCNRYSVTGEEYIVFSGGVKEEGEKIQKWGDNPYEAWKIFLDTLDECYFNIPIGSKIYWRWKPRLHCEGNKWVVSARLLISKI